MENKKRLAGDFEIIVSFPIGSNNVVIGMNRNRQKKQKQCSLQIRRNYER